MCVCACGGEGLNTTRHSFRLDSNSGQTPSPSLARLMQLKKKQPKPQLFAELLLHYQMLDSSL